MLALILTALGLVMGVTAAARAQALSGPANRAPAKAPTASQPGALGAGSGTSTDLAVTGYGDGSGYHLEVGRESSGFAWREIAVLDPDGIDDSSWTGYQCVSGDERYAAVSILPASAVNLESARDHGGFAYSVNLSTGQVRPIATGVGLMYFSPGCGVGDDAVFSLYPGTGQTSTQTADRRSCHRLGDQRGNGDRAAVIGGANRGRTGGRAGSRPGLGRR